MKIITINNTDYPFKVSYSVFKKAMTLIPDQEDMSEAALGTLEMVEKVGALAINQGLKSDGQNKRISSKDLVEMFDQDDNAFAIVKDLVIEGISKFNGEQTEGESVGK